MVQVVEIPLEWANSFPGVSGIRDVEFRVPEVSDIEDAVDDAIQAIGDLPGDVLDELLASDLVLQGLEEFADQLDPGEPLPQTIAEAVAAEVIENTLDVEDVVFPTTEEIAEAVADRLDLSGITTIEVDIEGSLFDIQRDLIDLLEALFREADLSGIVEDLPIPEDLPELVERVLRLLDRFGGTIDEFTADPLGTATRLYLDLLRAVIEEAGLDGILDDPAQWLIDTTGQALDQRTSDETKQVVADLRDDIEP